MSRPCHRGLDGVWAGTSKRERRASLTLEHYRELSQSSGGSSGWRCSRASSRFCCSPVRIWGSQGHVGVVFTGIGTCAVVGPRGRHHDSEVASVRRTSPSSLVWARKPPQAKTRRGRRQGMRASLAPRPPRSGGSLVPEQSQAACPLDSGQENRREEGGRRRHVFAGRNRRLGRDGHSRRACPLEVRTSGRRTASFNYGRGLRWTRSLSRRRHS